MKHCCVLVWKCPMTHQRTLIFAHIYTFFGQTVICPATSIPKTLGELFDKRFHYPATNVRILVWNQANIPLEGVKQLLLLGSEIACGWRIFSYLKQWILRQEPEKFTIFLHFHIHTRLEFIILFFFCSMLIFWILPLRDIGQMNRTHVCDVLISITNSIWIRFALWTLLWIEIP